MIRKPTSGFTMIEMVITVAIIGILLSIAIPGMVGYRRGAQKDGCKDQMRSILAAIEEARLERDADVLADLKANGSIAVLVSGTASGNYKNKYLPEALACPAGGAYTVSYDEDADSWSVACPNATALGHAL